MKEGHIWKLLEDVISYTPRILLYGIPGTGKTFQANTLGLRENQEVYNITLTHDREVVSPAEGFQVVATMNGVPADLPDALRDRFPVNLGINEVHPSALESLPKKLQSVYQDYNEGNFSVRKWSAFAELLDKGCELPTAASVVFTDNCADIIDALTEDNDG